MTAVAFNSLAPILYHNSRTQLLIRKNSLGQFQFTLTQRSLWHLIKTFFGMRTAEERQTVQHLKELLGDRRLERIFCRPELGLKAKALRENSLILSKAAIHKIFIGLSDIRYDDLSDALQGKNVKDLSLEEMDALYGSLLPFQKFKGLFCQSVPYLDKAQSSGKGFKGLQERVWTILTARKQCLKNRLNPLQAQVSEIEMLTSRLADREPPVGTVVRLRDGYATVDRVFSRGGAHAIALSSLSTKRLHLVCRGTASRFSATGALRSIFNCYQKEIGSWG